MARMYSRKHGKSGSHKPVRDKKPAWVKTNKTETEKLVVKYAKEGHSSAEIGRILRDQHGIPSVKEIANESVSSLMKKNDLYPKLPEDLYFLIERVAKIMDHLENNKGDAFAIHGLELTESKVRRLGKYYKKKGVLPADWKYNPSQVKLLVK